LGSRHTQQARREWLTAHGVAQAEQARIHGPAGLDLDAHTPAEIAISIVAEILAHRAGTTGGSLRERPGPVHAAGVNAPPPRY
jgi:xanthine dehydrogenase accessory factor